MIGLKPCETLEYVRDNSITARIVDDRSIEIDGNTTSLSLSAPKFVS